MRLVKVDSVEEKMSKNNKPYWHVITEDGDEVFCYDAILPGDLICIETKHKYCGKVSN